LSFDVATETLSLNFYSNSTEQVVRVGKRRADSRVQVELDITKSYLLFTCSHSLQTIKRRTAALAAAETTTSATARHRRHHHNLFFTEKIV